MSSPSEDRRAHWEQVHQTGLPHEMSWFQREAELSCELISRVAPERAARIIDVGGGASRLVDGLLDAGYRDLTVLDLAPAALAHARARLGQRAELVTWLEADLLEVDLPAHRWDVWHDRAVFHFLTAALDRARYVRQVRHALQPGGHLLVATFAHDGPPSCSGLPVVRYTAESLQREFGAGFDLVESVREEHVTPRGAWQAFIYCVMRVDETGIGDR